MAALQSHGFTGRVEQTLEPRLGRPVNHALADLGRMLWFDEISGLNNDNSCGGCHSPLTGFGDTQSIAIGIDNNGIAGPGRKGPRNQRRTPMAINAAFYPKLMWNGRFASLSGDPFDNSQGFSFPAPEGMSLSNNDHLLIAQVHIPPTERVEAAGFDFVGDNEAIRAEVVARLNDSPGYIGAFGAVFPEVDAGSPITYEMFSRAIAELEFTLVFANAPIDRFARGHEQAMTDAQKRGALLFFGKAKCVNCHAVSGDSNEMFSDFDNHVLAVPQIVPTDSNMVYDGAAENEDYGLEQVTGDENDRYKFRTSPLRNLAVAPTFMHNGAFTTIESAIRHHLDVPASVAAFTTSHLAPDLQGPLAPMADALSRVDAELATPTVLTDAEFDDLIAFVRDALTDERARQTHLERLIPSAVPSGLALATFVGACSADFQCGHQEYCDAGMCEAKLATGDTCTADNQCDTGNCKSGKCKFPGGVLCKDIVRAGAAPTKVHDALLNGDNPASPAGVFFGSWTGESIGGNENLTLVQFDLAGIPPNAEIRSATARIQVAWNTSLIDLAAHPVLASWSESTVTYQNFVGLGAWDPAAFDSTYAGGDGYKSFDVTALVADWHSGALPNRGLLIREPVYDSHYLYTSEAGQSTLRPRLRVCFAP
ncbi:MAG: cytochrome c peroxidase [Polyangiaceae bacterium]